MVLQRANGVGAAKTQHRRRARADACCMAWALRLGPSCIIVGVAPPACKTLAFFRDDHRQEAARGHRLGLMHLADHRAKTPRPLRPPSEVEFVVSRSHLSHKKSDK